MKKTLGSLILFFAISLFGSSLYDLKYDVSDFKPYVKEGVEIVFKIKQLEKTKVMYFELKSPKSDLYELHLLEKSQSHKSRHENFVTYIYMFYPLKEGKIEVHFNLKVSMATDEGVEKFYTGSRDVINPMAHEESLESLKPLLFDVKPIEQVDLVGDFKLVSTVDKKEVSAYEQINATFELRGKGYPQKPKSLLPPFENVESFLELQGKESSFVKGGKVLYRYALLAEKDFEIPPVQIRCFSPTKKSYYKLETKKQKISVTKIESKNLLDERDSYPTKAFDWESLLPYFNGLLLFLAGFISAKLEWKKYLKKDTVTISPMREKISKIEDEKVLLKLLLSSGDTIYQPYIKELEESIYGHKKVDFKKLKEKLSKL